MSKTFRVDPKTFEEEVERRYLKRRKTGEEVKKIVERAKARPKQYPFYDDCDEDLNDIQGD